MIKVSAGLASSEGPSPWLEEVPFSLYHMVFPLCWLLPGATLCVQSPLIGVPVTLH